MLSAPPLPATSSERFGLECVWVVRRSVAANLSRPCEEITGGVRGAEIGGRDLNVSRGTPEAVLSAPPLPATSYELFGVCGLVGGVWQPT